MRTDGLPGKAFGASSLLSGRRFPFLVIVGFGLFVTWLSYERFQDLSEQVRLDEVRRSSLHAAVGPLVASQVRYGVLLDRGELEVVLKAFVASSPSLHGIWLLNEEGKTLAGVDRQEDPPRGRVARARAERRSRRREELRIQEAGTPLGERPVVLRGEEIVLLKGAVEERLRADSTETLESHRARWIRILRDELDPLGTSEGPYRSRRLDRVVLTVDAPLRGGLGWKPIAFFDLTVVLAMVAALALIRAWLDTQASDELGRRLFEARERTRHLEAMGLAAAGLAHETRNPLNVVSGIAQSLEDLVDDPKVLAERARIIVSEVDRINARLSEFMAYSRPRSPRMIDFELRGLMLDLRRLVEADVEDGGLELRVEGEAVVVHADEEQTRQVLFNLVMNGIAASPRGGRIVMASGRDGTTGPAWFEVRDEGPGVAEVDRERIFDPYVSLDPGGTGLGLAVVLQVVQTHGWSIAYIERSAGGAVFRVDGIEVRS